MAAVDVICTDKTGTLTTNRLQLARVMPLAGADETAVRNQLRLFASASVDRENKSLAALRAALGDGSAELVDQIPFKSRNRYSAVRLRDGEVEYTMILGACEALRCHLVAGCEDDWELAWKELLPTGLRVLMYADADHQGHFARRWMGSRYGRWR